ncbi:hypothetical protein BD560DRAFT_464513 [Blakeslea trispora]|nr:hypothetical protein BD560DRAFT_464513 [Blakeslea trispora]
MWRRKYADDPYNWFLKFIWEVEFDRGDKQAPIYTEVADSSEEIDNLELNQNDPEDVPVADAHVLDEYTGNITPSEELRKTDFEFTDSHKLNTGPKASKKRLIQSLHTFAWNFSSFLTLPLDIFYHFKICSFTAKFLSTILGGAHRPLFSHKEVCDQLS